MNGACRILVTGSSDWDDEQELRLALIGAAVPRLPVVVVHGTDPAGAMAARWAADYGVRTEPGGGTPDVCLAFGCDPAAGEAEGIPVRRYLRSGGG